MEDFVCVGSIPSSDGEEWRRMSATVMNGERGVRPHKSQVYRCGEVVESGSITHSHWLEVKGGCRKYGSHLSLCSETVFMGMELGTRRTSEVRRLESCGSEGRVVDEVNGVVAE